MSYVNDNIIDDSNVIYINGNENEPIPGFNVFMARMAELYIDNYMDPEYLDGLDEDETIVIDYTMLSDEEMSELSKCAIISLQMESDDMNTEMLLS